MHNIIHVMPESIFAFAESLRTLLECETSEAFDTQWVTGTPESLGWESLERAWKRDRAHWEPALHEIDGLLRRLLQRLPRLTGDSDRATSRIRTFRYPALERLQHATAAALVAQRYGTAGLQTVLEDPAAPKARQYFSLFALAERHPPGFWEFFASYLRPEEHYAFAGAAAEAARFYPDRETAIALANLFDSVRDDEHMRSFLGPRILDSLYVIEHRATLPFCRSLLTSGHTHQNPLYCEVTRGLVMVYRFTDRIESCVKFADSDPLGAAECIQRAERIFALQREVFHPVRVI